MDTQGKEEKPGNLAGAVDFWLHDSASCLASVWQTTATRRLIAYTALLVLTLQVIAVVFSYHREREYLLSVLDANAQGFVNGVLVVGQGNSATENSISSRLDAGLKAKTGFPLALLGYRIDRSVNTEDGVRSAVKAGGNTVNLGLGKFSSSRSKRYFQISRFYDTRVFLPSLSVETGRGAGSVLLLRVDASHLDDALSVHLFKSLVALVLVTLLTLSGLLLLMRKFIMQRLLDSVQTKERLNHFSKLNSSLLWETDNRLRLSFVNNKLPQTIHYDDSTANSTVTGLESIAEVDEVCGELVHKVFRENGVPAETVKEIISCLKNTGAWEGELQLNPAQGEVHCNPDIVRIVAEPIECTDTGISGYRGLLQDITENAGRSRELEFQANHDELTGLSNRRALEATLHSVFQRKDNEQTATSVCMLDLDQFKLVNDSCGHAAGDALLLQVAKLLQSTVRSSDLVARVGGDEFCIVLQNCSINKAVEIAEKIRLYVKDYRFHWRGTTYTIGVSIGIVGMSREFETPAHLVNAADACLYRSKRNGRNQIQIHVANNEQLQQQRAEMESINSIKKALKDRKFVLYFQQLQPCESRRNNSSDSYDQVFVEILIRMIADDGSQSMPRDFLPVAERFNLLTEIDQYVCNSLFDQLSEASKSRNSSSKQSKKPRISVNLSAFSVVDRAFQSFLLDALELAEFATEALYFEIPERSLAMDFDLVSEFIKKLAATGCGIIVDEFGYGGVSVSQLQGVPLSALKLSTSITSKLDSNHLSQIVLRSIIDSGPMLDVDLIAQHVEDSNLELLLLSYEFDFLQGYYYAQPQELVSIAQLQCLPVSPALTAGDSVTLTNNKPDKAA